MNTEFSKTNTYFFTLTVLKSATEEYRLQLAHNSMYELFLIYVLKVVSNAPTRILHT